MTEKIPPEMKHRGGLAGVVEMGGVIVNGAASFGAAVASSNISWRRSGKIFIAGERLSYQNFDRKDLKKFNFEQPRII